MLVKKNRGPRPQSWLWFSAVILLPYLGVVTECPAQSGGIPETVSPSRLGENIQPRFGDHGRGQVSIPETKTNETPLGADEATFVYRGLQLEGVSVLPVQKLEALWSHPLGSVVTVGHVFEFANSLFLCLPTYTQNTIDNIQNQVSSYH